MHLSCTSHLPWQAVPHSHEQASANRCELPAQPVSSESPLLVMLQLETLDWVAIALAPGHTLLGNARAQEMEPFERVCCVMGKGVQAKEGLLWEKTHNL